MTKRRFKIEGDQKAAVEPPEETAQLNYRAALRAIVSGVIFLLCWCLLFWVLGRCWPSWRLVYGPCILVGVGLSVLVAGVVFEAQRIPDHYLIKDESALEAAKLLKDWCVWMTGIATAAIAAAGILINDSGGVRQAYASIAVSCFCFAIVMDAWLLGSLPSLVARIKLNESSEKNDLYEQPIFSFLPPRYFRFGFVAGIQHLAFVMAIVAFALSALLNIAEPKPKVVCCQGSGSATTSQ